MNIPHVIMNRKLLSICSTQLLVKRLPITLLPIALLLVTILSTLAAEEKRPLWPQGIPQAMIKDAIAVLHINKPHEMISTIERTATDAGVTMGGMLKFIAKRLYYSRNLSGIDIDRPMVILWRKGRGGMAAIIPIMDRKLFFSNFARIRTANGVMVRINEKDGTTVYKHTVPGGMLEYRMLIRNHTAYFARNKHECELLAENTMKQEVDKPFLRVYIDSPYDFLPNLETILERSFGISLSLQENAVIAELGNILTSEYDLFMQQLQSIEITAEVLKNKTFRLQCVADLVKTEGAGGGALKMWASRQQNQSSRLLSVLEYPKSVCAVYGNIHWTGGVKEMGVRVAKLVERYSVDAPSKAALIAKSVLSWCALVDRRGAFASTLHMSTPTEGVLNMHQVMITEQTRAVEMLGYQQLLDAHLMQHFDEIRPLMGTLARFLLKAASSVGDVMAVGAYQGYWLESPTVASIASGDAGGRGLRQLRVASDAHYLELTSNTSVESIRGRALGILEDLDTSVTTPIGQAGIIVAHINLHHILRVISNLGGGIGYEIPAAEITASLVIDNAEQLQLRLDIPIQETARAMSASDWTAFTNFIDTLFSEPAE